MTRISESDYSQLVKRRKVIRELDPAPMVEKRRGKMNKWEVAFQAEVLEPMKKQGEIQDFMFEGITLTIYAGSEDMKPARYTPDFDVWREDEPLTYYEIKGYRRPASILRLKAVAAKFPTWKFILVEGGPGTWKYSNL